MTPAELKRLRKYDKTSLHLLSSAERLEYILLLRKLRQEVQTSLDFLDLANKIDLAVGKP